MPTKPLTLSRWYKRERTCDARHILHKCSFDARLAYIIFSLWISLISYKEKKIEIIIFREKYTRGANALSFNNIVRHKHVKYTYAYVNNIMFFVGIFLWTGTRTHIYKKDLFSPCPLLHKHFAFYTFYLHNILFSDTWQIFHTLQNKNLRPRPQNSLRQIG